ncbi:acetylxylan esterase [Alienimonas sp. DA493]|uniref:glucuronyl esterase domain-containing protein n=1 Tax=Alienimonas sp. DA493 TaxID=3373605 RepID=UPI003754B275
MLAALLLAAVAAPQEFNYDEAKVPDYTLPPVLAEADAPEDWPQRRAEIVKLFEQHVYGVTPPAPESIAFETSSETVQWEGWPEVEWRDVTIAYETPSGPFSQGVTVVLPAGASAEKPAPVFTLIRYTPRSRPPISKDEPERDYCPWGPIAAAGCAVAVVYVDDVAPDDKERFDSKLLKAYGLDRETLGERPADGCGALAAWGWGASRFLDYCEQAEDLDAERVAILGHSRAGKAAWWAGARDPRFSVVISNNSGCGGAALSRRRFGETVAKINDSFPHWFCPRFRTYDNNEDALPVDQHMLAAAMAPRAVYAGSASEDGWADPRGEFLSLVEANPAFALCGDPRLAPEDMPEPGGVVTKGRRGYHLRPGGHSLKKYDWERYLQFATEQWKNAAD